jgi:hypothetical protein
MKKAQANIIAVVLIILLVLVAIVILWNVVTPLISDSSEQARIEGFESTFDIDEVDLSGASAKVKVKRSRGDSLVDSIKIVFERANGENYVYEDRKVPDSLETFTYIIPLAFGDIVSVSVTPTFGNSLGIESKKKLNSEEREIRSCVDESDCGSDGFVGDTFCQLGEVYKNYTDYTCENPATESSVCTSTTTLQLIEECEDICFNGECAIAECHNNEECGSEGFVGDNFCKNNSVYRNYRRYICENPGTHGSNCNFTDEAQLVEECDAVFCEDNNKCEAGQCIHENFFPCLVYFEDFESGTELDNGIADEGCEYSEPHNSWGLYTESSGCISDGYTDCSNVGGPGSKTSFGSTFFGTGGRSQICQDNGGDVGEDCGGCESSYAILPLINLSTTDSANLYLDSWTNNEEGCQYYDVEYVEVSTDRNDWSAITECPEYPLNGNHDATLRMLNYSLDSYLGQSIYIRFRYDTVDGCCGGGEGWYVDNIKVVRNS